MEVLVPLEVVAVVVVVPLNPLAMLQAVALLPLHVLLELLHFWRYF